jgi:hypothetical protein
MMGVQYLPPQKVVCHNNQPSSIAPYAIWPHGQRINLCPAANILQALQLSGDQSAVPTCDISQAEANVVKEEGAREDDNLLVIPLSIIVVRPSREGISFHGFSWFMNEGEVIFHELRKIVCNTSSNILWMSVVLQVFMVHIDFYRVSGT